jgi:hypothetical protein
MCLTDNADTAAQASHDVCGKLVAQIHAFSTHVEQQVAGRRLCVARARAELVEWMEVLRPRRPKKLVPGRGSEADATRQVAIDVAGTEGADKLLQVATNAPHTRGVSWPWLDRQNKEDGIARLSAINGRL